MYSSLIVLIYTVLNSVTSSYRAWDLKRGKNALQTALRPK